MCKTAFQRRPDWLLNQRQNTTGKKHCPLILTIGPGSPLSPTCPGVPYTKEYIIWTVKYDSIHAIKDTDSRVNEGIPCCILSITLKVN